MNQRITVEVGADITGLEKGMQRGAKTVNRFGNEVNRGEKQVGKFGKTTKTNAVPAMTSFSQVIQDSPYGIRGVANNIQQLTSQMGYLATSAGGVGGAMKALVGSLIGPAGILLAVSVVTSLLVAYGDKLEFAASQSEKLAEATKKYVGEAMTEISQLRILISIAEDVANSTDVRGAAIEEINKKYGKYLGNLDLERLKTDEVRTAIQKLTLSMLQQAKIKGLKDIIDEKNADFAEDILKTELEKEKALKKQKTQLQEIKKESAIIRRLLGDTKGTDEQIKKLEQLANGNGQYAEYVRNSIAGLIIANDEYGKLSDKAKDLQKESADAVKPFITLQEKLKRQVLDFEVTPTFSQEEVVIEGTTKPEVKVQPTVDSAAIAELNEKIKEALKEGEFLDQELAFIMPTENAIGEAGYTNNLNESWLTLESQFDEHLGRMEEKMLENNLQMQQYAMMLSGVFAQMANQITDSLLEGKFSIQDFMKSTIKAFASMLISLGQQAIQEKIIGKAQIATDQGVANANAIVMASNAAAAMGPAGVVAFPGLLAQALAITNGAFAGAASFNDGGIVGGGMPTGDKILARLNSGEMVLNQSQQSSLFRLLNGTTATGGSEPLEIVGETIIEGDSLRTVLRRSDKRNNRIG